MPEYHNLRITRRALTAGMGSATFGLALPRGLRAQQKKQIVYLTPGLDLPFWRILSKGIADVAQKNGAAATTYDSHNNAQTQIQNAQDAIARKVDGIVISPTDSSTCPSVLDAAQRANIPVVIADIGTTGGEYVSFIISDNFEGAYGIGKALANAMKAKGWDKGTVGLVTISLARKNGQARTAGFRKANLYCGRNVQVRAGHAHGPPRHARPVHRDRPADHRRPARAAGDAAAGAGAGRRL